MSTIHRAARTLTALIVLAAATRAPAAPPSPGMAATVRAAASAPEGAEVAFAYRPDPTPHDCFHPPYPPEAARAGAQGLTTLSLSISSTGQVTRIGLKHSAGDSPAHKLLDQAAVDAIASCPIAAARDQHDRPIAAVTEITFTWQLE